ncbi:TPA: PTS sugar transporter subunit IIC, partial [Mannheimia haemolytica]|nr:PTS sugar transporter subunit IIC [Mannheimia haemolytica]
VSALPAKVITGLNVAGKIIPAIGIGLLMLMMIKKAELWTFLIAGFTLAVYLKLSVLPITLIALPLALIYDLAVSKKAEAAPTKTADEEDYDL